MPNVYNSTHTGQWQDDLFNLIYPVGSLYFSANNVNPGALFGGTWEQIEDTFLLCAGSTYTGGSTGGAASVSSGVPSSDVSGAPSNNTSGGPSNNTSGGPSNNTSGSTAISVAQMPSHGHPLYVWDNAGTTGNAYYYNGATKTTHTGARIYYGNSSGWYNSGTTAPAAGSGRGDPSGGTGLIGGGGGHTHTLSSHTHTLSSHTHTLSSHTHSLSAHTHTVSTLPPYLAVYVWQRIS